MRSRVLISSAWATAALWACLMAVSASAAEDAAARLTNGKLQADLGEHKAAAEIFSAIADDTGTAAPIRGEALVRLGAVRLILKDAPGAAAAFERAFAVKDEAVRRLLALTVSGVVPSQERWSSIWKDVGLGVDRRDPARPAAYITWPGVPQVEPPPPRRGAAISLRFDDGDVRGFLRGISWTKTPKHKSPMADPDYSAPPELQDLELVLDADMAATVTVRAKDRPWDDLVDHVVAATGHVWRFDSGVLRAGRAENLLSPLRPAVPDIGHRITLDFAAGSPADVFRLFGDISRRKVLPPPATSGTIYARLSERPWDVTLDLILQAHGLAAEITPDAIRIGSPGVGGIAPRPAEKAVDIAFERMPLPDVLRFFERAGAPAVSGDLPAGMRVTWKARRVPWDRALAAILWTCGLDISRQGEGLRVTQSRYLPERAATDRSLPPKPGAAAQAGPPAPVEQAAQPAAGEQAGRPTTEEEMRARDSARLAREEAESAARRRAEEEVKAKDCERRPDHTVPCALSRPMIHYPAEARAKRIEGTVLLKVLVGTDGLVKDVKVVREVDPLLVPPAVEAAQQLRFSPALKDGVPVSASALLAFPFKIKD